MGYISRDPLIVDQAKSAIKMRVRKSTTFRISRPSGKMEVKKEGVSSKDVPASEQLDFAALTAS